MFSFLRNSRSLTIAVGTAAIVFPHVFSQEYCTTYPANNPNEDRYVFFDVGEMKGGAVFDGHGGWQISDFLSRNISKVVNEAYERNAANQDKKDAVSKTLSDTFDSLEGSIVSALLEAYDMGFGQVNTVGSCGVVAIVSEDFYAIGNAGDCQAILVSEDDNGRFQGENLAEIFSANLLKEQERLRSEHPNDEDIVVCRSPTACYVKSRLMCTRAFGDLHLKDERFNNPLKRDKLHGVRRSRIENWTGPYITHRPDIVIHDKRPNDRFLILASDGLWDTVSEQKAAEVVQENQEDIAEALKERALLEEATEQGMTLEEIKARPVGKRRSNHDDITILVIPLR